MSEPLRKIPYLPERIERLDEVVSNLSWRWNREARALFRMINHRLWQETKHNPIEVLQRTEPARLAECAHDPEFLHAYDQLVARMESSVDPEGTWFQENYPEHAGDTIAYFCAEFGLHNSVPIYSGGLGVLAGDHCKAASDLGLPFVGVGLFYLKGYFDQKFRIDGWQEDGDEEFDFGTTPLERVLNPEGGRVLTTLETSGRDVQIGAWTMKVGRVQMILLDTDLEGNHPDDRQLTYKLYAGGPELRLKQEWILGVGGVRVLRALGINPAVFHANEGHAAFMFVERVREFLSQGMALEDAETEVRRGSLFTTHTPVPAGHDMFSREQVRVCAGSFLDDMGIPLDRFWNYGYLPTIDHDTFHMTALAIRLSAHVNGVAKLHGEVSRDMFRELWPERSIGEVPIGYITNGVHLESWMADQFQELLDEHLGENWSRRLDNPKVWDKVLNLDDERVWEIHQELRETLVEQIREFARRNWRDHWTEAVHMVAAGTLLNPSVMTLGFARRFATYKRANLLFREPERLRKILTNPDHPVQLVFAGKAHPADEGGKKILQEVYEHARDPRFEGRVAFLEDYDMHVALRMVHGVDLWLNLPRVPREASGTSGMKAGLNGVPQLSTLDGWWAEGFTGVNGWSIPLAQGEDVDAEDAEHLFDLLENQIVPLYYDRDETGLPRAWIQRMKHALWVAGQKFTTRRMVQEYTNQYYVPAMRRDPLGDQPPTV